MSLKNWYPLQGNCIGLCVSLILSTPWTVTKDQADMTYSVQLVYVVHICVCSLHLI